MSDLWIVPSFASSTKKYISKPTVGTLDRISSPKPPASLINNASHSSSSHHTAKRKRLLSPDDATTAANNISMIDFEPTTSSQLAVSRQKITELKNWFVQRFSIGKANSNFTSSSNSTSQNLCSPFLLLNGPAGSGKTISVKVLCKEFNVELVELQSTSAFKNDDTVSKAMENLEINSYQHRQRFFVDAPDHLQPTCAESQQIRFKRFLNDLNRYRKSILTQDEGGVSSKLLLIEEVPNIFHMQPKLLHDELNLLFNQFGSRTVPIVFIISETANGPSIENLILPKTIQTTLGFTVISFRPITNASLTKVISKCWLSKNFTKSQVEEIVSASSNDIRNAFNYLLFKHSSCDNKLSSKAILNKKAKSSSVSSGRSKLAANSVKPLSSGREEHLNLSHAIAKILYAKRLPEAEADTLKFIKQNKHFDKCLLRNPLKEQQPEEIAERSNTNCDTMIDWIFENYVDFVRGDEALQQAVDCLQTISISDSIFRNFDSKDTIESMRQSFLIRGEMFFLNPDSSCYKQKDGVTSDGQSNNAKSSFSFRALRGPQMRQVNRDTSDSSSKLVALKDGLCYDSAIVESDKNLVLDILPFVKSITSIKSQSNQLDSFVDDLCTFSHSQCGSFRNQHKSFGKLNSIRTTNCLEPRSHLLVNHSFQSVISSSQIDDDYDNDDMTIETDSD